MILVVSRNVTLIVLNNQIYSAISNQWNFSPIADCDVTMKGAELIENKVSIKFEIPEIYNEEMSTIHADEWKVAFGDEMRSAKKLEV